MVPQPIIGHRFAPTAGPKRGGGATSFSSRQYERRVTAGYANSEAAVAFSIAIT
jgi:hypothetical protein